MKPITPQSLREWGACYGDDKIVATFKRARLDIDGADPIALSNARSIPAQDRAWVLLHALDSDAAARVANKITDRAVRRHALRCGVPVVEAWAKRWLDGSDRSAGSADAACDAAHAAVGAAYDAARAARAAYDAAYAAYGAAYAAYGGAYAAYAARTARAAYGAEWRTILAIIRKEIRRANA